MQKPVEKKFFFSSERAEAPNLRIVGVRRKLQKTKNFSVQQFAFPPQQKQKSTKLVKSLFYKDEETDRFLDH